MTITNTEKLHLKACKNVSLDRSGVDAWGIYVLFVDTDKWNNNYEHRVFIADKLVCQYVLRVGGAQTRTTWTLSKFQSRDEAIDWLTGEDPTRTYGGLLRRDNVKSAMVGAPVLVQLTESDVESIRKGRMPAARYRGQQKHQTIYGKVDAVTQLALNLNGGFPTAPRPALIAADSGIPTVTLTASSATITTTTAGSHTHSYTAPVHTTWSSSIDAPVAFDEPINDEPF